ncbi:MAG: 16S rRNA (adenine(1518)-N(6)/adenine(1519)-N(6))-dimethyltransferase RsmA [Clostridia bacterium]|nr:16S rRNA (adenine(1518)-N(6)/adenine(1519)-N(6))-dimethyltransferase RsmA [Clostridia bacterium]
MNLADIKTVESLLRSKGFSFKKSLGQNFLIDDSVCPSMAESFCDENSGVIEIGPGMGVLTAELAKRAKKVVSIELDERLKEILPITLGEFSNVEIIYGDAMKIDIGQIIREKFSDCESVSICANLPYYITSPIIMMLLEQKLPVKFITVMVQKEAAERLCAKVGSREAGAVTVAVDYYSKANILFGVGRNSFHPAPNVDSAVIQLEIRDNPPIEVKDEGFFFKFVKACFAQRRKTLVNTVSNTMGISKDTLRTALTKVGLSETARSEQLTMEQLAAIANTIC